MRAQLAQKQASHAPPSPPWYQATSKQAVAGSPAFSLLPLPLSVSSVQAMPACSYTAALRTTEVSAQRGRQKVQRRTQRCVDSGLMNCCIMRECVCVCCLHVGPASAHSENQPAPGPFENPCMLCRAVCTADMNFQITPVFSLLLCSILRCCLLSCTSSRSTHYCVSAFVLREGEIGV